jgi:hypothetical protein
MNLESWVKVPRLETLDDMLWSVGFILKAPRGVFFCSLSCILDDLKG